MEKPRDRWNPKREFWTSPGIWKGFLEEEAHELIGMNDTKRRERCAGQEQQLWECLVVKCGISSRNQKILNMDGM